MASLKLTFVHQNLPVERIWSEVNARVKYPIKKVLVEMDNNMEIHIKVDVDKIELVAELRLNKVVQTWNSHSIPGIHLFDHEKKCCFTKQKQKFENQICI